ncbi:MAG TPA: serine/threonine-protein kinase, partial [Polyangiales bacterium]
MDGVASKAPEVEAAGSEPDLSAHTGIRSIAPLLPERRELGAGSAASLPAARDSGAGVSAAQLLSPGTCVDGKYIICDVLGTGGSATVYAAEQVGLKRVVAFKLYPLGAETSPALRERFEREAELLARVQHENVVAVFDSGRLDDGSPYLVVQRLQGQSLASHLASAGPLPLEEAVELALQVANALAALGAAGITHRDVKPDNLVLDPLPDGRTLVKLVDFGIALSDELEGAGSSEGLMGTPHYMAPEQVSGAPIDARCDQYALGATLYEMLTGRTPHNGESLSELARAIMFAPITPVRALRPDCPAALEAIIMRALAREPRDRFASARALKQALEGWRARDVAPALGPKGAQLEDTLRVPTGRPAA